METIITLDVTVLEPRLKHPTIFDKFDSLNPGEAFIIHNDHDPKPLYYQLLAERGQTFSWEYLINGPEFWEVKISKKDVLTEQETIGDIVTKDFRKAQVFKRLGIDFCCGGKKSLEQVCEKKGLNAEEVRKELDSVNNEAPANGNDYLKWNIGFLSDYIINTHHQYVKDNAPFILELANKVARVHGANHPEMIKVAEIFAGVATELTLHLMKEETILFPFIKELAIAQTEGGKLPASAFGKVSNPIQMMEMEHEEAGDALKIIRELTNNFSLPPDACNSYTILYKKLDEFENDLHVHVHLENNILFPKSIQLEKQLLK